MKIYIDVSNLLLVNFVTGIQRVVREVTIRMLKNPEIQTVLLSCQRGQDVFDILDNEAFLKCFDEEIGDRKKIISGNTCALGDLEAGSVFFDIDSVWGSHQRRSQILPQLKRQGVKLAVYIYDIIPITYPQYCHENTAFFFMSYLAAYLQYADIILTSTQSTLDKIGELLKQLNLPLIEGCVTWLGADFAATKDNDQSISSEAKAIVKRGKYILCVGTVEPRKNHKLLLDAFDKKWSSIGINLVFAGRFGWNIDELEKRIKNHPEAGKRFFHLSGQNDATIDYLYRNAFLVALPTFEEGFGLPIIEAIERETVLIASDIPVLREVGKGFCDYFNPYSTKEIISVVDQYLQHPEIYKEKKQNLKEYVPVTWDTVTTKIVLALKELECKNFLERPLIKQMVILSARPDMLLSTLPYIEKYMRFIKEIVVCCPDKIAAVLKKNYSGNLILSFLTDNEILNGSPLPGDHATRNFYLRCLAMKSPKLDDVFIMSDDDYRPLCNIDIDCFYKDGKYKGYYCGELKKWGGTVWSPTSFDVGMKRTMRFLESNHYPCKQYASHMPQIIDKKIFNEMLEKHEGMEGEGYCEWSTYFNYLEYHYPSILENEIYKVMCWPGNPTDWKLQVVPTEYLFENYYEENYCKGHIFSGFSTELSEYVEKENAGKIRLFSERQMRYQSYQNAFELFEQMYCCEFRELPQFGYIKQGEWNELVMPKYLILKENGFAWIPFELRIEDERFKELEIHSYYSDIAGNSFYHAEVIKIPTKNIVFDMPLYGYRMTGNYYYNIEIKSGTQKIHKAIPISIIK